LETSDNASIANFAATSVKFSTAKFVVRLTIEVVVIDAVGGDLRSIRVVSAEHGKIQDMTQKEDTGNVGANSVVIVVSPRSAALMATIRK
jgi:hypothetical protein